MTIANLTAEQLQAKSIPEILTGIKELKDFPAIKDIDEAPKPVLIAAVQSYSKAKEEVAPVVPAIRVSSKTPLTDIEAFQKLIDAGFKNKEEVLSCLEGADKSSKLLVGRVRELDEREAVIAAKEVEVEKIEGLLRKKTVELEGKLVMNKALVQQLHDAKK